MANLFKSKAVGDIVQITNGFVDHHSIPYNMSLMDEWRKFRLPDTVQVKWILWHTWNWLAQVKDAKEKASSQPNPIDEDTLPSKSRKSQTVNARDTRALKRQRARIAKGKTTLDEYEKTHIYRCPHATCAESSRLYAVPSVFDHLYVIVVPIVDAY